MRGAVETYDANSETGIIAGDGIRLPFARDVIHDCEEIAVGMSVIFDHDGERVTDAVPQCTWSKKSVNVTQYEDIDESSGPGLPAYVVKCLVKFFNINGRAQRAEFWSFVAFATILVFAAPIIAFQINQEAGIIVGTSFIFAFLIGPFLAVSARRLHDLGASSLCLLLLPVPLIGWIVLLLLMTLPSQRQTNRWGRHPKARKALAPSVADVFS